MKKSLFVPLLSCFLLLSSCNHYVNKSTATQKDYDYSVSIKINDALSYDKMEGNSHYKIEDEKNPMIDKDSVINISLSKNNLVKKYVELNYLIDYDDSRFDYTFPKNEIKRIKKNIAFNLKDYSEEIEFIKKIQVTMVDNKYKITTYYPNVYFRLTVLYVNNEYGTYRFYSQIKPTYQYYDVE